MDMIYPISFLVSLGGLVTWFFVQGNKSLSRPASATFLTGFLAYLLALTFASADFNYKLLILFRDLVVLGVVSQLFNIFQKNKILSLLLAAAVVMVLYFSYFNVLSFTFPQVNVTAVYDDGEFLIERGNVSDEELALFAKKNNCEFRPAFNVANHHVTALDEYFVVNDLVNTKSSRKRIYSRLSKLKGIEWIEPNETMTLEIPESDVPISSSRSFVFNDPGQERQWGLDLMNVGQLHELASKSPIKPGKKARLAIIDSGIDANHEDLKDHYVSFKKDYDNDPHRHGTHCAGIAAAVTNNGKGIASYMPGSEFVSITGFKVMNSMGVGTQQKVIQGIIDAVDNGADVISMSLGGPTQRKKERAYKKAVDYAAEHNAVVIVAAGNNNSSAKGISPANVEGVITVSAVNQSNAKAFFSNTVSEIAMGIAAPGQDIYSTIPGDKYAVLSGTSMATPYVAGLVAVMKSIQPDLTTKEVYHILRSTGKPTSDGHLTGPVIQPSAAIGELID